LLPDQGNLKDIPFINISVNPIEASVVCPKHLAEKFFHPFLSSSVPSIGTDALHPEDSAISIAPDEYILMFVTGSGSQPSQRVIDLTTPLALAGIPIFFITTYFSDYIICPSRSRAAVIAALEARGFELTHDYGDISHHQGANYTHRPPTASSDGSGSQILAPGTPPPSTLSDLEIRTFATLKKRNIVPAVNPNISLVSCAGKDGPIQEQQALLLALIRSLLMKPKFFSLTIAEDEAPSILLEQGLLPLFTSPSQPESSGSTQSTQSLLLGTSSDKLVPIMLDLRSLPTESTGIVCGVAGKLVESTRREIGGPVEMSYLSTAKAGSVIVSEVDLDRAIAVLEGANRWPS
jgi:ACT domain